MHSLMRGRMHGRPSFHEHFTIFVHVHLCKRRYTQQHAALCQTHVVSLIRKTAMQVKAMVDEGIFDMQKYVDGGWITALKYDDEVLEDLKKRTAGKADKLRSVSAPLTYAAWTQTLLQACSSSAVSRLLYVAVKH